ncbi:hypothetical protein I2I11_15130 [Pontibacter sp. 172403-2]|uniref:hypothetical protein n=1 Tax=Pontibacter rufus TaxID=2791028 RepID=UPI0018AF7FF5|nr:hypothetical protein [Pontibacter sp. 172403-2]MBF9254636.1 hypothetical protein [Pontibacter sp. 172403-2]
MNKLRLLTFLFTALFLTTLASCSKDDDAEPSKKQLLTAHEWVGSDIYVNGTKQTGNPYLQENLFDINTVKLNFKDDRTYTATFRVNGTPQTQDGIWELYDNDTKLNLPFLNEPGDTTDIKRLTENNLDISTSFEENGTPITVELRFVK